jgi:hypothetical protein
MQALQIERGDYLVSCSIESIQLSRLWERYCRCRSSKDLPCPKSVENDLIPDWSKGGAIFSLHIVQASKSVALHHLLSIYTPRSELLHKHHTSTTNFFVV